MSKLHVETATVECDLYVEMRVVCDEAGTIVALVPADQLDNFVEHTGAEVVSDG